MRLTNLVFRQHIHWHFNKHWNVQRKRKVIDQGVEKALKGRGITVFKPEEIFQEKGTIPTLIEEVPDYIPKPVVLDKTHPDWHERVCYTYKDNNVLLEGLNQAKFLTKTVELQEGLPSKYNLINSPQGLDKKAKTIILNAHVFDAEQQKLPVVKDPTRPAWNFPRTYGITDDRVNKIILTKLLQLIELTTDIKTVAERNLLYNLCCSYPYEKDGDLILLELRSDMLLTSINPLSCVSSDMTNDIELTSIHPVKYTNTLNKEHIYKTRNIYPIKSAITKIHPHTLFVHNNGTEIKNVFEEEVTESQILGRSLMKAFCVAASYAKQQFSDSVQVLPKPVTVQCIQTDGRVFDFGVLQLNTLDLNNSNGIKNVWYYTQRIPLFTSCSYKLGRPILEGYNNNVLQLLVAFYNSI